MDITITVTRAEIEATTSTDALALLLIDRLLDRVGPDGDLDLEGTKAHDRALFALIDLEERLR